VTGPNLSLASGATATLAPGAYGTVVVPQGAILYLTGGTYTFVSLSIDTGGIVQGNTTSAPLVIYVQTSLHLFGSIVPSGGPSTFLLGYAGSTGLLLESPFAGTLLSPNATLDLASLASLNPSPPSGGPVAAHQGAFFATSIDVHQCADVVHVPFGGWSAMIPLQTAQIQNYIDENFYTDSDVVYSFVAGWGQQIDCINFYAQHSVKALLADGVSIPTAPTPPASPPSMPPPNVLPPNAGFAGQPDVNGLPQQCPSGTVPTTRPTIAQIEAAGGISEYQAALPTHLQRFQTTPCAPTSPPMPPQGPQAGCQDVAEHDCYLNNAPGDVPNPLNTPNVALPASEGAWEHAVGIQNSGFSPPGASGYFGMQMTTSMYPAFVPDSVGHSDSQFWAQTGTCENWYGLSSEVDMGGINQCQTTSSAPYNCSSANPSPQCAVQSLEVGAWAMQGENGGVPSLFVFYTPDGYSTWCQALGACTFGDNDPAPSNCPNPKVPIPPPGPVGTAPTGTMGGTVSPKGDCWVEWTDASFAPGNPVLLTPSPFGVGVMPAEITFGAWNGSNANPPSPGWWVYVNQHLIGWLPPIVFNWNDKTAGPMATGPATYLQTGGEVQDSYPNGFHADTTMVSPNNAMAGFGFAAYNRNVGYWDSSGTNLTDANLVFPVAPASEGDNQDPGLCGFESGGWVDETGAQGAYSVTNEVPPGFANWGTYLYFGGGVILNEVGGAPPTAVITLSNVSFVTSGGNLFNCETPAQPATEQSIIGLNANGQLVISCIPDRNPDGTLSQNAKTTQQQVSSGNGHGALVVVTCSGTGLPGNVALNGSVTLDIEQNAGSGQVDTTGGNEETFSFTNLVPGLPQTTSGFQSCDVFSDACATGMQCLFNAFTADISVANNSGL
jgi:hypothetical protein